MSFVSPLTPVLCFLSMPLQHFILAFRLASLQLLLSIAAFNLRYIL